MLATLQDVRTDLVRRHLIWTESYFRVVTESVCVCDVRAVTAL